MDNKKFWQLGKKELLSYLSATEDGLTSEFARKRILKFGRNILEDKNKRSALKIFWNQISNWLVITLALASFISFYLGQNIEGIVIIVLVLLSALFGFVQEYKAEKTIADLKKFISNRAKVKRDGKWKEIDATELVPGDILELRIGDKVPADVRLLSTDSLAIDESVLTGESQPVEKISEKISTSSTQPQLLKNIAFSGTTISDGYSQGVVVATGEYTYLAKTAQILAKEEPHTDFQKQIRSFSLFLFKVIMFMTLFIFLANSLLKKDVIESFLFALALAVGITPEMLPAIITVTLSQGAMKMAKKKTVVKRLVSVEDLGNVDALCADKTGTLTEGKFVLENYLTWKGKKDSDILAKALVCTSGGKNLAEASSNSIDRALWVSEFTKSVLQNVEEYTVKDENEFDYERRRMSVLAEKGGKKTLISKGAFESIINICNFVDVDGKRKKMGRSEIADLKSNFKNFEEKNYRILTVCEKHLPNGKHKTTKDDEKDMVFLGFLLFNDPLKPGVDSAIAKFQSMGVNLKILSGDSLSVTESIAAKAGINFKKEQSITGEQLDNLSEENLRDAVRNHVIFARVTPEQKYKIIESLNYEGHVVGFLGDGVNDVAALRAADVGISVDTGTEIAKDAADIILLEKDLGVLAEGIEAGRKTFGNIMKYILNTISANYGNMFTVAISSLFIKFIPLLPSQILLNNFISDIPLFAVATDNVDPGFVKKPKRWNLSYIKSFMVYYGFVSTFFDLLLILPMIYILKVSPEVFRTAWFVESSISEILVTFVIRTKMPFYKSRPSSWLLTLSFISIGFVILMPTIGLSIFEFTHLPIKVWGLIAFDLFAYFAITEIVKKSFFSKFELEKL